MTTRTQRHVWICALLMMLAAPLAYVTWPTVVGSSAEAAMAWTAGLSVKEIEEAGANIEKYPFAYRREIMRALSPEKRSSVWRAHLERYLRNHPALSARAVADLRTIVEIFTPRFFSGTSPSGETLNRLEQAAVQVREELGRVEAGMLLERLGASDSELVNLNIPSLLTFARNRLLVQAQYPQCECATQSDYCDDEWHCHFYAGEACNAVVVWPMCGTGWMYPCDGMCIPNH